MIKRNSGEVKILPYKKAASTVFAQNDVVTKDASGYLVRATASTPRSQLIGLIRRDVASTDADYASNTLVEVETFLDDSVEFIATVDTGTLTQAMVGSQYDLADHNGIDVTVTAVGHVTITRFLSATQAVVKFNTDGIIDYILHSFTQTITRAQFTDGGSTSGTKDLGVTIPAGAVYVQTILTALTGFIGDTTATMIVGVTGGDTDRYSTGTPSVFTTAAAGIDLGVPSGTKWHTAAAVPTVLIVAGSDFTAVSAGQATITCLWYQATA